jgi:hypothetical protein
MAAKKVEVWCAKDKNAKKFHNTSAALCFLATKKTASGLTLDAS